MLTRVVEIVEMLQEITGSNIPAINDPLRPGDIKHSSADISKARDLMGYEPSISLLDGLRETVNWYREQE